LTDGAWDRGLPLGGGERCDPVSAFGGSGSCYLTDRAFGNSDVDGGPTRLTSPTLNLSAAGDYRIAYERWWCTSILDVDALVVEISNNNGTSWTTVESISGNKSVAGWQHKEFNVADFVAPTAQVRMRFSATDGGTASVAEGGLDAFRVVRRT